MNSLQETHRIMSKKELKRGEVISQVLAGSMTIISAAQLMNLSYRQARRLVKKVKRYGQEILAHGLRGRKDHNKVSAALEKQILSLYEKNYADFNINHFCEKLQDKHQIEVSREWVRKLLYDEKVHSPRRKKKRAVHVWRQRKKYEGELLQIDGSHHRWLEDRYDGYLCLMAAIDDATGKVYARFYAYEGVMPIFDLLGRYTDRYGVPRSIYCDRHSTYTTTLKKGSEDRYDEIKDTQFQRTCKELDISCIYARSPQAKGRVERLFKTLQDRLVKEMRLATISTIEEANVFLEGYLNTHNEYSQ